LRGGRERDWKPPPRSEGDISIELQCLVERRKGKKRRREEE
jgi:hypothetical protein